jgi:hypothetical protein
MATDDFWLRPELTFEEQVELGYWFAGERVTPVSSEDRDGIGFFRSAAHLGSGYILSARDVLEKAFAATDPPVVLVSELPDP